MNSEIVVFGAGGHTRSLIPLIRLCGYNISAIYDDSFNPDMEETISDVKLVGRINDFHSNENLILSFGNGKRRKELYIQFQKNLLNENLVHPSSIIDESVKMNSANQIFQGTIINAQCLIGKNNIINTGALIEHEVEIGDFNHISIGSIIAGRVKIGSNCFIGAGAVIIDKLTIADDVIIGANAVVVKDIYESGTYVGNPAKKIK